jgi:hypothetical protein
MFLSSTLISALLASGLAACGGSDSSSPATFATASGLERTMAVMAAAGEAAEGVALSAVFLAAAADARGDDACATSKRDGTTLTVDLEPCAGDKPSVSGRIVVHGYSRAADAEFPTAIEVHDLRFAAGGDESVSDGDLAFSTSGATDILDTNLSVRGKSDTAELALSIDSRLSTTAGTTTADAAARVTIDGVGHARIEGSWSTGDRVDRDRLRTGSLSLIGVDTLRIDLDRPVRPGCYPTTIDGAAVDAICLDDERPDDDEDGALPSAVRVLRASLR